MKLILTAAVDKLGEPGDVVEVKNGYGRNFLLPRGLAIRPPAAQRSKLKTLSAHKQTSRCATLSTPRSCVTSWISSLV